MKIQMRLWATLLAALALSAGAAPEHDRRLPQARWHGDISRFHEHDWPIWRSGRWTHVRHGGQLGWWWVVGGNWYLYPAPVYPYPNPWEPPPTVIAPPPVTMTAPPAQYWYYCEPAGAYFPYVPSCPAEWKQVPAVPTQ